MADASPQTVETFAAGNVRIPGWRSALVAGVIGGTLGICLLGQNPNSAVEAGIKMELPERVGDFWGYEQDVTAAERKILASDTQFAKRSYESMTGDKINCQIVLSGGQKERSIHRPEICLDGQGWKITSGSTIPVPLENGKTLEVMKLDPVRQEQVGPNDKRRQRLVFLYWFVGKDITTPYHWKRILLTSYDRVVHNLNHRWAYVIVSAPVMADLESGGKDEQQTVDMLKVFIRQVVPTFNPPATGQRGS